MNWLTDAIPPRIKNFLMKKDVPRDLWIKCPETGEMVFHRDLEENNFVIPKSGYHMRMPVKKRLEIFFDDGEYSTLPLPEVFLDPLKFRDEQRYVDRLKAARSKTGLDETVFIGFGKLDGLSVVAAVQSFDFMGGSLGTAAGEAIIAGMYFACEQRAPFVLFVASGGARMQEGILSLMQMPRTIVGVQALKEARLPYLVVMTNPTSGGVTASYAMLGDIHIAEPGAFIGFAGPRVIEQTVCEKLPHGFQRSEYLLEHGMVDMVVHRNEIRGVVSKTCHMLMKPVQDRLDCEVNPEVTEVSEDLGCTS